MEKKPIIGIVLKHKAQKEKRPNMYIRDEIKQAIFDHGGVAIGIILPKDERNDVSDNWNDNLTDEERANLIAQIKLCDGIIFQGGGLCDNYEMIVAKYCYDHDIPTLGICCGQNVMVRAIGGTTRLIDNPLKHNDPDHTYVHEIKINQNSRFYKMIGKEKIKVNSRHKKTIDQYPHLIINAICEDGYIDGVEAPNKKFYMAFRFHPESLYKIDEDHNKIFAEFIHICRL